MAITFLTNEDRDELLSKINEAASSGGGLERVMVNELPTTGIKLDTVYLVPAAESEDNDQYDEYIFIPNEGATAANDGTYISTDGTWEVFGGSECVNADLIIGFNRIHVLADTISASTFFVEKGTLSHLKEMVLADQSPNIVIRSRFSTDDNTVEYRFIPSGQYCNFAEDKDSIIIEFIARFGSKLKEYTMTVETNDIPLNKFTTASSHEVVGSGSVNVDSTLSVSGAAADAAVVGEKVSELSGAIANKESIFSFEKLLYAMGYDREDISASIPVVYLDGDLTGITADDYVNVTCRYIDPDGQTEFTDFAEIAYQGSSSMNFTNVKDGVDTAKNYKIKLYKDEARSEKDKRVFKDWFATNNFHIKANFGDCTNFMNNMMMDYLTKSYQYLTPLPRDGARYTVDGFPIRLYINGVFCGIRFWNLKQDDKVYNFTDENDLCYQIGLNNGSSKGDNSGAFIYGNLNSGSNAGKNFANAHAEIDYYWEDRVWDKTSNHPAVLYDTIQWVSEATDEEFKENLANHFDVDYLIHYFVMMYTCGMGDSICKNFNMLYFPEKGVWYPTWWDMDFAFGTGWGLATTSYTVDILSSTYGASRLFTKLWANFKSEIVAKYKELRKTVLTEDALAESIEETWGKITSAWITKNKTVKYDGSGYSGFKTDGAAYVKNWASQRFAYIDTIMVDDNPDVPDEPDIPDEPDATDGMLYIELGTISSSTGAEEASSNRQRSDFVEVTNTNPLIVFDFTGIVGVSSSAATNNTNVTLMATRCYDSDKSYIGTNTSGAAIGEVYNDILELPTGTKYVRFVFTAIDVVSLNGAKIEIDNVEYTLTDGTDIPDEPSIDENYTFVQGNYTLSDSDSTVVTMLCHNIRVPADGFMTVMASNGYLVAIATIARSTASIPSGTVEANKVYTDMWTDDNETVPSGSFVFGGGGEYSIQSTLTNKNGNSGFNAAIVAYMIKKSDGSAISVTEAKEAVTVDIPDSDTQHTPYSSGFINDNGVLTAHEGSYVSDEYLSVSDDIVSVLFVPAPDTDIYTSRIAEYDEDQNFVKRHYSAISGNVLAGTLTYYVFEKDPNTEYVRIGISNGQGNTSNQLNYLFDNSRVAELEHTVVEVEAGSINANTGENEDSTQVMRSISSAVFTGGKHCAVLYNGTGSVGFRCYTNDGTYISNVSANAGTLTYVDFPDNVASVRIILWDTVEYGNSTLVVDNRKYTFVLSE